jgi:hypothetical protein
MGVNISEMAGAVGDVMQSIGSIVKTVSESRNERERIILEGVKIRADIADRITLRENETIHFMEETKIKLEELNMLRQGKAEEHEERMANIEYNYSAQTNAQSQEHEYRMAQLKMEEKRLQFEHEQRMSFIELVRECLSYARRQYDCYRDDRREYGEEYFPIKEVFPVFQSAISQIQGVSSMLIAATQTQI